MWKRLKKDTKRGENKKNKAKVGKLRRKEKQEGLASKGGRRMQDKFMRRHTREREKKWTSNMNAGRQNQRRGKRKLVKIRK